MSAAFKLQKVSTKEIRLVVDLTKDVMGMNEVKVFKHLESRVTDERMLFLLAREAGGGRPMGIIECTQDDEASLSGIKKRGVVRTLYVAPEFRRQGVAHSLLETASYWFKAAQVESVVVPLLDAETEPARGFLQKNGFSKGYEVYVK